MAWCHQSTSHYLSQCWPSRHAQYLFNTLRPNEVYDTFNTLRPDVTYNTFNTLRPPWGIWHIFSTLRLYGAYSIYINILTLHESYNTHLTHWINTLTLHESHNTHLTHWDPIKHITYISTHWQSFNTFNILRPKETRNKLHDQSESASVQTMAWCQQATNPSLSQCWHRSLPVSPYGLTKSQWVKFTDKLEVPISK